MYICIEGVIGVGKTTLTDLIAEEFKYVPFYEKFSANPFLENLYEDKQKWGFHAQMFFLTDRYTQAKELNSKYLDKKIDVVSDYHKDKTLLFSKRILNDADYKKFEKVFYNLMEDHVEENLLIVLTASLDTLMERIQQRNRPIESSISREYIGDLIEEYDKYINYLKDRKNVLIIETDDLDLINNTKDKKEVMNQIKEKLNEVNNGTYKF